MQWRCCATLGLPQLTTLTKPISLLLWCLQQCGPFLQAHPLLAKLKKNGMHGLLWPQLPRWLQLLWRLQLPWLVQLPPRIFYNWIRIGACLCADRHPSQPLNRCQFKRCQFKLHHLCQAEWENGGQGQDIGECKELCVAHHPAASAILSQSGAWMKVPQTRR